MWIPAVIHVATFKWSSLERGEGDYCSMCVLSVSLSLCLFYPLLSSFLSSDTFIESPAQFKSVSHGSRRSQNKRQYGLSACQSIPCRRQSLNIGKGKGMSCTFGWNSAQRCISCLWPCCLMNNKALMAQTGNQTVSIQGSIYWLPSIKMLMLAVNCAAITWG